MNDKKLLVILILLSIYIWGVKPLLNKMDYGITQLKYLRRSISKEKFINQKLNRIEKLYPKYMNVADKDSALFFSSKVSASEVMSEMQGFIKSTATRSGVQLLRINWGNEMNKKGYSVLPISLSVKGYPYQIDNFLKDLYSFKKLIRFESVTVMASTYSSKPSLNAIVKCFKLNKGI